MADTPTGMRRITFSTPLGWVMAHRFFTFPIIIFAGFAQADGLTFTSPTNGYHVDIAPGWVQVPSAVIAEQKKQLSPEMRRISIETAVQPGRNSDWLVYPYVLVQPVGRASQGLITEQAFGDMVTQLKNARKLPVLQSKLTRLTSSEAQFVSQYADAVSKAGIHADATSRRFWLVADVAPDLKALTGGAFLSNGMLVQLSGYCEPKDLPMFIPVFLEMLRTLRPS